MEKRWEIKSVPEPEQIDALSEDLGISKVITKLLVQRGISTYDDAFHFFRPSFEDLHDPFLMLDMDKAIERIERAIEDRENIMVYGDYDVDGTTSVALVFSFFKRHYPNLIYYIPDRYNEGYGISYKGIDTAHKENVSLIIALDCGIKAVEKIDYAKQKGIDFIICDHHLPGDELPKAHAILDPKQPDCEYPYKELSGCGVGFKLIQAYAASNDIDFADLEPYLDLVAISIAADIVDVTGENRVLAYYGLKQINQNPRPGIESILEYTNIKRTYDNESKFAFNKELMISDLVFTIGPRINAAGRVSIARNSVDLLKATDRKEADRIASDINEQNDERRNLDSQATEEALEMIKNDERLQSSKTTVVYSTSWHKGVLGIVASRLTETYYRPSIVFNLENGMLTGSARSVKGFDVYSAIDQCSDLLENFGGHKYAAGLSMKEENIKEFIYRFEDIVAKSIDDVLLVPEIEVDAEIDLKNINKKFYNILRQFAPFGPGNMSPVFVTRNVLDSGHARVVGNDHLKLQVVDADTLRSFFDSIAFQQGDKINIVNSQQAFDICYSIGENTWNGRTSLQLFIKDIKSVQ
jgi:single-stranded-DNA-specific exonuclease